MPRRSTRANEINMTIPLRLGVLKYSREGMPDSIIGIGEDSGLATSLDNINPSD
jgi:hypothetical protein